MSSRFILAAVTSLVLAGCHGDCILPPCALGIALDLVVTSGNSGGGVTGVSVAVSGPVASQVSCDGSCMIPGPPGTYSLTVTAPGYQALQRTVVVAGTNPPCGCPTPETTHVNFVLLPSS